MTSPEDAANASLELTALRILCQGAEGTPLRAEGSALLDGFRFRNPVHQVVFDALCRLPSDDPEIIRSQLPARLNNRGFPDMNFEEYFAPHGLSREQAIAFLRHLGGTPFHSEESAADDEESAV